MYYVFYGLAIRFINGMYYVALSIRIKCCTTYKKFF